MATKRQVFYSFHYNPDCWRAATVRNIGAIEGNRPAPDNDWQTITKGGDKAIEKWINDQMKYRSCTVVLIGSDTANRKWINYEIVKSWNERMGIVGIYINGLKNSQGFVSARGSNPFDYVNYQDKPLSRIIKSYDPIGLNSKDKYDWISKYLSDAVEEAISTRSKY